MKLSDVTTKLTCMKSKAFRVLAAATLAGAVLAAAPAVQAQHFAIGVQFGGPRYVAPAPVYFERDRNFDRRRVEEARRREEIRRREEFRRHQRWEREHRFHDGRRY